jgi:predicted aminopeptidase
LLILLSRFRKTGLAVGLLTAVLFALPFTQLTGCASPAWYSQAISGHLGLMAKREDIDQVLASGSIDPETARELELAVEIREFAISRLALPANDSYTQYVPTGKDAVTWNVVAAPEFSLEPRQWCFMVSGCVPYRGYFKRAKAENFARKLADDGLDTTVSPAMAYSTLGWFDDPLLSYTSREMPRSTRPTPVSSRKPGSVCGWNRPAGPAGFLAGGGRKKPRSRSISCSRRRERNSKNCT